ncbi:hypothetical protein BDQ17DRAFT_1321625 [Cyathus striatus]|nr:hypothetical protein BDQ17DRAFT_1321625 [Cyathus striatus]
MKKRIVIQRVPPFIFYEAESLGLDPPACCVPEFKEVQAWCTYRLMIPLVLAWMKKPERGNGSCNSQGEDIHLNRHVTALDVGSRIQAAGRCRGCRPDWQRKFGWPWQQSWKRKPSDHFKQDLAYKHDGYKDMKASVGSGWEPWGTGELGMGEQKKRTKTPKQPQTHNRTRDYISSERMDE